MHSRRLVRCSVLDKGADPTKTISGRRLSGSVLKHLTSILVNKEWVPLAPVDMTTVAILGAFACHAPSRHATQMPTAFMSVLPFCVTPPAMISGVVFLVDLSHLPLPL